MRRTSTWVLPWVFLLLGLGACQSGGTDPLSCLSDLDCPEPCTCSQTFESASFRCQWSLEDETVLCGGTCTAETECPEGTECRFTNEVDRPPPERDIYVFACAPATGTGGSGGSGGGAGGTGGAGAGCDVCGQLDCDEFADDDFAESDWDHTVVFATGNTYGVEQRSDDGNPAPYRFVHHEVDQNSSIWVAHERKNATYDPGMGRIDSIHFSFDGKALPGSRTASIRPLVEQAGSWFWTAFTEFQFISENGWVNKQWSDVELIPASGGELNLEGGASITFGFATGASHTVGAEQAIRDTGVDNWRVVICHE